ncbi:hypothetical protein SOVF_010670 [Spinacia oleracea]|nr:hypothetical protein SOVF_010670 [Spinacia oleracea]
MKKLLVLICDPKKKIIEKLKNRNRHLLSTLLIQGIGQISRKGLRQKYELSLGFKVGLLNILEVLRNREFFRLKSLSE